MSQSRLRLSGTFFHGQADSSGRRDRSCEVSPYAGVWNPGWGLHFLREHRAQALDETDVVGQKGRSNGYYDATKSEQGGGQTYKLPRRKTSSCREQRASGGKIDKPGKPHPEICYGKRRNLFATLVRCGSRRFPESPDRLLASSLLGSSSSGR